MTSTRIALALVFTALPLAAPITVAQDIIPRSTSPDGTRALMSEPRASGPAFTPAKLWVIELPSKRKLSPNLVPTDEQAYTIRFPKGVRTLCTTTRGQTILQNDQLLFDDLSSVAHHDDPGGVNYKVRWSHDLRRVTVSGGAHKFYHSVIFYLDGRRFYRAPVT